MLRTIYCNFILIYTIFYCTAAIIVVQLSSVNFFYYSFSLVCAVFLIFFAFLFYVLLIVEIKLLYFHIALHAFLISNIILAQATFRISSMSSL